jgi:hypothetical protein
LNITIEYNTITSTAQAGLSLIWDVDNIRVLYNNLSVTGGSSYCLSTSSGSTNFFIYGNILSPCISGMDISSNNSLIANNTIIASTGSGLQAQPRELTFENNSISSANADGVSMLSVYDPGLTRFVNNTIHGGDSSSDFAFSFDDTDGPFFLANNTIVGNGDDAVNTGLTNVNKTNFTGDRIIAGSAAASDALELTGANGWVFENVTVIGGGGYAIYSTSTVFGGNVSFINSSISGANAAADIYLQYKDRNYLFINTTLNRSGFFLNQIMNATVVWFADAIVTNLTGDAEGDAGVNITDSQDVNWFQGLTGSNGRIAAQNLTELRANGTFIYNGVDTLNVTFLSNYTFNATKDGYTQNSTNATINQSRTITIVIAPITGPTCGTLTSDTTLTGPLSASGTCITIGAQAITLDCAGFSITGDGTGMGVANIGYDNITVKNCVISNFNYGVLYTGGATNGTILNDTIYNNSVDGILVNSSSNFTHILFTSSNKSDNFLNIAPIMVSSSYHVIIANSTANNTGGPALMASTSDNLTIANSSGTSDNGRGITLSLSNNASISNSTASTNNDVGLEISSSNNSVVNLAYARSSGSPGVSLYITNSVNARVFNSTIVGGGATTRVLQFANANASLIVNSSLTSAGGNHVYSTTPSYNNTIANTTFDRTLIEWGSGAFSINNNLTVKWYVNFSVRDNVNNPVPGAGMNGTPAFGGASLFDGTTNDAGDINAMTEFTEFTANGTFDYSTPYTSQPNYTTYNNWTFSANKTSSLTNYTNATINRSQTITIFLVPATCGISANTTLMGFGDVEVGIQSSAIAIGINNTGTVDSSVYVAGTIWANDTFAETMPVDRSHYNNTDSSSAWSTWTPLTTGSVNVSNISVGNQVPIFWRALVPLGTPAYVFRQNITYSTQC